MPSARPVKSIINLLFNTLNFFSNATLPFISKSAAFKLHNSIQHVLKKAIKHNGTTIIDFSYVNGQSGNYANELNIYGKKGLICSNCKTEVVKIKVASRGTYFCRCQKVY